MKKTLLSTLVLLLISVTLTGQSVKITEFTTSHIHGVDFEGVQNLPTSFEVFTDSIVMTFIDPQMVAYFEQINQPVSTFVLGNVQLLEENEFGRVYYLKDAEGEIILRDYNVPSVKLNILQPNGTVEETNFITFEKKGRL